MKVITRFAPSPTGYLHIGGARTALFNYLFAKANGGEFLLRIEDTDKERSTQSAVNAIFDGLKWLGINWSNQVIFQSKRAERHRDIAYQLVKQNKAYYCFVAQEQIDIERKIAINNKESFIFHSPWRDADPLTYPKNIKPVIRLKTPKEGKTIIYDQLQGEIIVENNNIDDMIILRSDGSPTYMLAVVVDDHDMSITHIIRGDDHLTNATRQALIYRAMNWQEPVLAHIPLIHGQDGSKLSKRHGALGVDAYKSMGYLPEAMCNYLLRLGWAHGDDEIISRSKAISLFTLSGLNKGACKLDFAKMNFINAHYIRNMDNELLINIIIEQLHNTIDIKQIDKINIKQAINSIKMRAELMDDVVNLAQIYVNGFNPSWAIKEQEILDTIDKGWIIDAVRGISALPQLDKQSVELTLKNLAQENNIKIGQLMTPIRILLTGMSSSPSAFELIEIIGIKETMRRISRLIAL